MRVCIILPAYNEGSVIADVLERLPRTHKQGSTLLQFDILVVDDGSADNTSSEAARKGAIVVRHLINMGAGAATRTGLRYAREQGYAMAVTMDADGQHAAEDAIGMVIKLLELDDVDLLIGSRLESKGNMPLYKKLGNRGLSYLTYLLLGTYVSDSQSGLRAYSKKALDTLYFHSNTYAFCSEMIWQAKRSGLITAEYPIEAIYTEYSKRKGQKSISGAMKIIQQLVSRRIMDLLQ